MKTLNSFEIWEVLLKVFKKRSKTIQNDPKRSKRSKTIHIDPKRSKTIQDDKQH